VIRKVETSRKVINIHEELIGAERLAEPFVQPTGGVTGFLSAVIDEDVASHLPERPEKETTVTRKPIDYHAHTRANPPRLDAR
jgi:hypothetical protein